MSEQPAESAERMDGMGGRAGLVMLIAAVVGVDQWTKALARADLFESTRRYGGRALSLTLLYAQNEGAFLSLGSTLPAGTRTAIFTVAVGIAVLVALGTLLLNRVHGADAVAVALIAAGGVGNLIDRIGRDGRVTDFLYLAAGPLHTGVFNIADMAITAAVVWLFVSSFRSKAEKSGS